MSTTVPAVIDHGRDLRPIAPLDLTQTKHAMDLYQNGVKTLLDDTDWQRFPNRQGSQNAFVKKSGWRKVAMWFSLSVEIKSEDFTRDDNGRIVRAHVIATAIAPNGRRMDGDGTCDKSERGFSKPEHDIPGTATTRAKNRAIADLVGMGAVSAEEVDGRDDHSPALPYGPVVSDTMEREAAALIQKWHLSIDGRELLKMFKGTLGVDALPEASFRMLKAIEWGLSDGADKVSGNDGGPA